VAERAGNLQFWQIQKTSLNQVQWQEIERVMAVFNDTIENLENHTAWHAREAKKKSITNQTQVIACGCMRHDPQQK
jgi:hypothetical protein